MFSFYFDISSPSAYAFANNQQSMSSQTMKYTHPAWEVSLIFE